MDSVRRVRYTTVSRHYHILRFSTLLGSGGQYSPVLCSSEQNIQVSFHLIYYLLLLYKSVTSYTQGIVQSSPPRKHLLHSSSLNPLRDPFNLNSFILFQINRIHSSLPIVILLLYCTRCSVFITLQNKCLSLAVT